MIFTEFFSSLLEFNLTYYLIFSITALLFYYVLNRETRNVPPGPSGLPIVGYIPFLDNLTAHEQLWKLGRKYGSLFSIKLGPNNCIIVNDAKVAVELLSQDATHARPVPNMVALTFGNDDHLISWRGPIWKEHRKFTLKALRTVGVGKPEMESLIVSEISYMLDQMDKDGLGSRVLNIDDYLTPSTSNVVNAVITGKRYDYDHPIRVKQDVAFRASPKRTETPLFWTGYVANFVAFFKLMQYFPSQMSRMFDEAHHVTMQYLIDETQHQVKQTEISADANIISAYISEMRHKVANDEDTYLDAERIPGVGASLLSAGSETVRLSLEWAFLYCAYFSKIQDKLIKELEQVIGYDRKPSYADRTKMPYTQAFIWETMRHATTIPLNLPHVALSDIQINGYVIPKDYHIFVNTWAIHNDPKYWDKPEEFKVERFLTPEGDKVVKSEALMPFSSGRRSCPGEPLAQVELFIYLTMTLQRYKIESPPGVELNFESDPIEFSLVPKHLRLKLTNRK